jgi:ubiquinone/menaquinone biosynthesis C-methylase UbiE
MADFLLWAFTPYGKMSVPALYDALSVNAFTQRGLYLNLGYWKHATTIDEACPALASLVAETAEMGPGDDVVDVGFGFADQDMLWARNFAPRHITGLNVTPSQVRIARARVRRAGLSDRIDPRQGSATAMQLPDACADIVTAVECAFHFDTRDRFFTEAMRVLRPGGRLVLADVIRAEPSANPVRRRLQDVTWRAFADKFAIPEANAVQIAQYRAMVAAAGFTDVSVTSISDEVFPGWHAALGNDGALLRRLPLAGRLPYRLLRRFDAGTIYGAFDYVLAAARKPA